MLRIHSSIGAFKGASYCEHSPCLALLTVSLLRVRSRQHLPRPSAATTNTTTSLQLDSTASQIDTILFSSVLLSCAITKLIFTANKLLFTSDRSTPRIEPAGVLRRRLITYDG